MLGLNFMPTQFSYQLYASGYTHNSLSLLTGPKPTQFSLAGNGTSHFLKTQGLPISKNVYSIIIIWNRCSNLSPALRNRRFIYFSLYMETTHST